MPDTDMTQFFMLLSGLFAAITGGALLILAVYFRFISRDDIGNSAGSTGSEWQVSPYQSHTRR
jgi:hypothetical protein